MKKYFYLLLALSTILSAETYLFGNASIKSGGFGGPRINTLSVKESTQIGIGGGGSWVINDTISLGLYGYGSPGKSSTKTSVGIGELRIAYNMITNSILNPFIAISHSSGGAHTDSDSGNDSTGVFSAVGVDIGTQIKITKWFRIEPYVGYKLASVNINQNNSYNDNDFSGLTYGASFNFGSWNK